MPLNSNVEPQKYMHPLFVGFLLLAISTSLTAQTWFADGHSTLDNSILSAAQISAHHNETLANISSFGRRVKAMPASDVRVEAQQQAGADSLGLQLPQL